MQVGLLVPYLSLEHGTGHYSLELIGSLQKEGIQVNVVTTSDTPVIHNMESHRMLPFVGKKFAGIRLGLTAFSVDKVLRNCDIIHSTVEKYAPLAERIAHKRPFLITVHGSYANIGAAWRWPLSAVYRRAFSKSACAVCVSRYTASRITASLPEIKTSVIPPGIAVERFNRLSKTTKSGPPTILCVAAIKRRKGIVHLVRAVAVVRQRIPNIRCIVIGTSEYGQDYSREVQSEICKNELQNHITLLGHVEEDVLLHWYASADIFVLPAVSDSWRFEGYGIAFLEAGAARLPVIGTTGCGAEDAVDQGVTGLLIPPESLESDLPQAIITLLKDPQLRERMGQAGRAKAERQTWKEFGEQTIRLYDEIMTVPGQPRDPHKSSP